MENLQGVLALLAVASLLIFFIIICYIALVITSIKKRLKSTGSTIGEGNISKSIFEQGYQATRAQNKFFKEGKWSGIDDPGIIRDLEKQLKLRLASRWCGITFIVCYVMVMTLNVVIHT